MVLGIKLEIDGKSVKKASKEITDAADKSISKKDKVKKVVDDKKTKKSSRDESSTAGKKDRSLKGALTGGVIGGFIGAIIGSLKPVQELLSVIGSIMSIFLVPILILMKPFLILFIKVGLMLLKMFSGGDTTNKVGTGIAVVVAIIAAIVAALAGAPALLIAAIALVVFFLTKILFEFGVWLGGKLIEWVGWLWANAILPAWEAIKLAFIWVGEQIAKSWEFIKAAASKVWSWIKIGFSSVASFGKRIWDLFVTGLGSIVNLGTMIWDNIKAGLSSIANLGQMIWDTIKSYLPFGGGGESKSVNDALITSSGDVISLNPNDNVLAFQDFSQVENMANSSGGSRGGNINITVHGFVGDEDALADRVAKALNSSSRGSTTNF